MKDFSRRFAVSAISIVIIAFFLLFAYNAWVQYAVSLFIASLAAVGIWEYEQFVKAKGGRMILPVLIGATLFEVLSFFFAAKYPTLHSLPLVVFFIAFLILFAVHFKQRDGAIVDLAVSSFGLLYLAVPMGMVVSVLYSSPEGVGRWWVAYLLVITKITDIGAYFAGSLWGRRKLAPHISPGKTVEGAIFGLLCAVSSSFVFYLMSEYSGISQLHLGTIEWLFLGVVLGLTSQFGDLSESLLKRDANKKDSNALPGIGGVLDALDSLLFNAPIVYLYLNYVKL